MKYYFGKVPTQDVEMFGDEGLFEHEGSYYYNTIEIGTNPGGADDFMISDTAGRSIPISTDLIGGMARVLLDIKLMLAEIENGKNLEADLYDSETVVAFE